MTTIDCNTIKNHFESTTDSKVIFCNLEENKIILVNDKGFSLGVVNGLELVHKHHIEIENVGELVKKWVLR